MLVLAEVRTTGGGFTSKVDMKVDSLLKAFKLNHNWRRKSRLQNSKRVYKRFGL